MLSEILELKKKKNALIIAHYYQEGAIQDCADYVGDSLGMALFANKQKNPIAVVCGVRFMAETLKVYNPDKKILLPDLNAGCSLADSCTPEIFAHFLSKYKNPFVMTYVNSSLAVKAMSDVICTSANAVDIAKKAPFDRPLIFAPDQHLGRFVAKQTGRNVILFPGNCFVHLSFSMKDLMKLKLRHPEAKMIAHPECEEAVLSQADFVGSTSQLLKFAKEDPAKKFIVMTEEGILHQMKKTCPDKIFINGPDMEGCACNICPHMKLNTLEKLYACLHDEKPEISVDANLAQKALVPLQRMIEMTKATS